MKPYILINSWDLSKPVPNSVLISTGKSISVEKFNRKNIYSITGSANTNKVITSTSTQTKNTHKNTTKSIGIFWRTVLFIIFIWLAFITFNFIAKNLSDNNKTTPSVMNKKDDDVKRFEDLKKTKANRQKEIAQEKSKNVTNEKDKSKPVNKNEDKKEVNKQPKKDVKQESKAETKPQIKKESSKSNDIATDLSSIRGL